MRQLLQTVKNYLSAEFIFNEDWTGFSKTAVFSHENDVFNVILEGDKCIVPYEVIKESHFYVSVFAGDLLTSSKARVEVNPSGLKNGQTPSLPTPDLYNQILTVATEAKDIAQSNSDLKKFKTVTLSQAVSAITISSDDDGIAFNLTSGEIIIYLPVVASDTPSICMQVNDITSANYYSNMGLAAYASIAIGSESVPTIIRHRFDTFSNKISFHGGYFRAAAPMNSDILVDGLTLTGINKFCFYMSDASSFPVGTIVYLNGVSKT